MTSRSGLRWTVIALGAVATMALGVAWHAARGVGEVSNVVVITLDTTRADRMSPYGFANVSLPSIERLARDGVVFDRASSVAPLTLPAHASLFTGVLPPHHGVRDNADPALADANTTLAEMLRARGFRTGAFVGSSVLNSDRGLNQGFDRYSDVPRTERRASGGGQRRADQVVDDAIGWLEGVGNSPFFLWAHLYDAHRPYDPPSRSERRTDTIRTSEKSRLPIRRSGGC
jgi:arylsulfatase A-like enzyme